jgi:dihydroorotate dehydrogenase (NAD+) catalytic subunit
MKIKLETKIGKLKIKNPVMAASGTWGAEYSELSDVDRLGAIVLKTITLNARTGNPPPRVAETASGMLNSIGLENKGAEDFIENKLPLFRPVEAAVIASVAGDGEAEFKELAKRLSGIKRIDAIELNLSCPNIRYGLSEGLIAHSEKATYRVVKAVRASTRKTIIAKLSPNVTDIAAVAAAAESAGADAVAVNNTFIGMAVDAETRRPKLGNVTGGLSGPAIKPLSLRAVWEVSKKIGIPIIGVGGIMNCKDAVEFILAGASAVQVGTANFVDPAIPSEIVKGLEVYCKKHKIDDISSLVGAIKLG